MNVAYLIYTIYNIYVHTECNLHYIIYDIYNIRFLYTIHGTNYTECILCSYTIGNRYIYIYIYETYTLYIYSHILYIAYDEESKVCIYCIGYVLYIRYYISPLVCFGSCACKLAVVPTCSFIHWCHHSFFNRMRSILFPCFRSASIRLGSD